MPSTGQEKKGWVQTLPELLILRAICSISTLTKELHRPSPFVSCTSRVSGPVESMKFEQVLNTSDYFIQITKIVRKCPNKCFRIVISLVFFGVKQRKGLIITTALSPLPESKLAFYTNQALGCASTETVSGSSSQTGELLLLCPAEHRLVRKGRGADGALTMRGVVAWSDTMYLSCQ